MVSFFFGVDYSFSLSSDSNLVELLPELETWKQKGKPLTYHPKNLYEYINGAAELYLSYHSKGLVVAEYQKREGKAEVVVEVYDMGSQKNSFGIYSAERFPQSNFIPLGIEGYTDEGSLNFLVNRFYVKLICFDCGSSSDQYLQLFAQKIVQNVSSSGKFPPILENFPQSGLVSHSEKLVLENFMGYEFFHDGYSAQYKKGELEFFCFILEGENEQDARNMLKKYLQKKTKQNPERISSGYHLQDPYYNHVYIALVKNYLCGVMKIPDEFKKTGETYLNLLIRNLEK